MCDWESQPLPGILENLPPLHLPVSPPYEDLRVVGDELGRLREVDIPDWLDTNPTMGEIKAALIWADVLSIRVDLIKGLLIDKAFIQ